MSSKVLIIIDADVLLHFFKADKISLLNTLYPKRLKMMDMVLDELRSNRTIRKYLDSIFLYSGIEEIEFPTSKLIHEYLALKSSIDGKGERATLVYCKNYRNIIASSNTSDIVPYCHLHSIEYLSTLDILSVAVHMKKITERDANLAISLILSSGSFLCCNSIAQHAKHFDSKKLLI